MPQVLPLYLTPKNIRDIVMEIVQIFLLSVKGEGFLYNSNIIAYEIEEC